MDLHHGDQGRVEIVSLGLLGVEHLHWICSAGDCEDRTPEEVLRELLSVEGGGRDNELQVWPTLDGLYGSMSMASIGHCEGKLTLQQPK